ncbi:MAG: TolC family protein [Deltaproteobacteria bacterium]|jgi:outer membrane protein TolC|nr:TolC family protein [Deltaproteobacteria bacterium]
MMRKEKLWLFVAFSLVLLCAAYVEGGQASTDLPMEAFSDMRDVPMDGRDVSSLPGHEDSGVQEQSYLPRERTGRLPKELPNHPLTLRETIDYGLAHNRILMSARQDVSAAGSQVRQAKADFYPKLDSSYSVTHMNEQPFVIIQNNEIPTSNTTLNRWEIDLSQPLFTGFALTSQLNISKLDQEVAGYRLEETRLNVIRDIQRAFFQVLLGEKLVQVAKDNVKSLEVHRKNAEAQFQQGLTAENDVLKADVALAQAQQQERATLKQLVIVRSRLNQLLDLDLETPLVVEEGDIRPRPAPELSELFVSAEKQRPEYLALEKAIEQTDENVKVVRSRYYPQVSAFAQYYREGKDFLAETNDFTNSENAMVGLKVDWNWFEGGKTRAAIQELGYRRKSLEEKRRDLLQQIRIQVEDAYEQLRVAGANIETARTALSQAQENERMTTLQYKEQLVIFLEVLNAQVFMAQSRADYFQALYGYQLAWADLERAVGNSVIPKE